MKKALAFALCAVLLAACTTTQNQDGSTTTAPDLATIQALAELTPLILAAADQIAAIYERIEAAQDDGSEDPSELQQLLTVWLEYQAQLNAQKDALIEKSNAVAVTQ